MQFVPWAEAHDKFVNSIAGGTSPDVAEVGTTWTPEFADAGALADLSDAVDSAGLDSDLVPGLAEAGTVDGELYGMPWYAGVRSVVYRTDVFEKAGVKPPTTWDELVSVGDTLKAKDPKMITFPVPGDSEYGVYPFIWGNKGAIAEQDGDSWKSEIDSDAAQKGIEFYTDLALKHGFSSPAATTWDEADLSDAFSRGDVAMMIAGSWTPGALVQANPDLKGKIGAFPIPGPEGGVSPSFLGGSHLSVFRDLEEQGPRLGAGQADVDRRPRRRVGRPVRLLPRHEVAARRGRAGRTTRSSRPSPPRWSTVAPACPVTPLYGAGPGQEDGLGHAPVDPLR